MTEKQEEVSGEKIASTNLLVDAEKYLKSGAHIGTRFKSGTMKKYIYKRRKGGLRVLDVQTLDERIRIASSFLAQFEAQQIAVASRKLYGHQPIKTFAEAIGAKAFTGRFIPGTFTNPLSRTFFEPKILVVTEPESDSQAIIEAKKISIPVIALCSTNNELNNTDLVIPCNNKGRKSLALVYWLLAREYLKAKEEIKSDAEFSKTAEDFEYQLKEGEEEQDTEKTKRRFFSKPQRGRKGGGRKGKR